MTAIEVNGYGLLDVIGFRPAEDDAEDAIVAVRLPSLTRCNHGDHTWEINLFVGEALDLIRALAAAVKHATEVPR